MVDQERGLAIQRALDVVSVEWAIDLVEVRDRVYGVLAIIEQHVTPRVEEYRYYDAVNPDQGERARIAGEIDMIFKRDVGTMTPVEAQLPPYGVCLLVWKSIFSTSGDQYIPVPIDIARVVQPRVNEAGDMVVDVLRVTEIPIDNPQLKRPTFFPSNGMERRSINGRSPVVVPLRRT